MTRALMLLAATACATLAVTSACFASPEAIDYAIERTDTPGRVQLKLTSHFQPRDTGNWSQGFALAELPGLTSAQMSAEREMPARFALIREAGRIDCAGTAGRGSGHGRCGFTPDPGFAARLAARGIARPDTKQAFALTVSGVRSDILDALGAARYPRPTIDQLVALGIFHIGPAYVGDLARSGYRLGSVDDLIAFKIHRVTPEFIAGFAKVGLTAIPADQLISLRIFNVTPDDVRRAQASGTAHPTADQLVERRIFAGLPRRARPAR